MLFGLLLFLWAATTLAQPAKSPHGAKMEKARKMECLLGCLPPFPTATPSEQKAVNEIDDLIIQVSIELWESTQR